MSEAAVVSRADGTTARISRRASVNWIMLIYFVSGACSLIDEVVWVRLLKLTLGNTVYATSIVVSVFMGGLALGALIMSRYSDRVRRRLRLYALLETLVTVSVLSLPWALRLADNIYVWFYRTYHPTHALLLVVQIAISAVILLVPSMLMGSTLPLLGRFVTALERQAGHLVGKLYALNTLGAATGCFLAGFVMIRSLGVMGTLYAAAGLNLLVAFGGWFLSRFAGTEYDQPDDEVALGDISKAVPPKEPAGGFYLLVFAFFMSGLISIGYELLWMRSIVHLIGGFTYVFSTVLTIYLLGNVIGVAIGSRLVMKLKEPVKGFAVTLSLLGIFGILYLPVLTLWALKLQEPVRRGLDFIGTYVPFSPQYILAPITYSVFLFLAPSILMGIGFPMALQAWANHLHKVGRSTGTAYGANTIGAVAGGIITGFVLIPLLGVQASISFLGLAGVWLAAAMWTVFARASTPVRRWAFLVLAVILTMVTVKVEMPLNLFGIVIKQNPEHPKLLRLLAMEEGVTATASVYRNMEDDTLWLNVSGRRVAGDTYFWRGDQKMLGHFGVLLNKNAKKVLSVGFGSGESTACLALHRLERADCVEIAPEVVKVALKFFGHLNLGDRLNEEINMIYMDAKNYIYLTPLKYDAIVNDSIHPRQFAENASLYTKEYFQNAREHLDDNGLFMSWIPTHNVEPNSVLNSMMGTMMEVFPHVTLWYMTPAPALYFLIVGSEKPQHFSPGHMENEMLKEGVRESLSVVNLNSSMDILSCYIGDQNDLRRCIGSYTINSDYWPYIEFSTDTARGSNLIFLDFVQCVRSNSLLKHIDWAGFDEQQKSKWLSDYETHFKASTYLLMSNGADSYLDRLKCCIDGLAVLPDYPALLDVKKRTEKKVLSICIKRMLSNEMDEALGLAAEILNVDPKSSVPWIVRSLVMVNTGQFQSALDAARTAVQLAPDKADAHFCLGFALLRSGDFDAAVKENKEALLLGKQNRESTYYNEGNILNALATAYVAAGRFDDAIAAAEQALDYALSTGRKEMAEDIRNLLLLFKAEQFSQERP